MTSIQAMEAMLSGVWCRPLKGKWWYTYRNGMWLYTPEPYVRPSTTTQIQWKHFNDEWTSHDPSGLPEYVQASPTDLFGNLLTYPGVRK